MPTYCGLVFYWFFPSLYSSVPREKIPFFIGSVVFATFLIPLLVMFLLKMSRKITNLDVTLRKERTLPFLSIFLVYVGAAYIFEVALDAPGIFVYVMDIVSRLILILTLIGLWFKISVHSAAAWGAAGLLVAINLQIQSTFAHEILAVAFVVAGLTSSSRLYLKRHTQWEIWAGVVLGFFFCFFCFSF